MANRYLEYKEAKCLCVRPMPEIVGIKLGSTLGYFNHCTDPAEVSNQLVEDEFFSGKGRFYYYDIKLNIDADFSSYQPFITEFLRRSETQDCLVHISNTIYNFNDDNNTVSLYNMPKLIDFIEVLTSIPQYIYFELDDKRFSPTSLRELDQVDELCRLLESKSNIRRFVLNETMHRRDNMHMLSDNNTVLAIYEMPYKELKVKQEENIVQKINMKQTRAN